MVGKSIEKGAMIPNLSEIRRLEQVAVDALKPYERNARTHSKKQTEQIARSIERFGFTNPVLIDDRNGIIAGHGRVKAARKLGIAEVPCLRLSHLSDEDRRAYIIADNKLAENAGWDSEILAIELQHLVEVGYDLDLTGFSIGEVDTVIGTANDAATEGLDAPEDAVPEIRQPAVTKPADIWLLGRHRLICGDARDPAVVATLMDGQMADMVFTDPPYNVPIKGHVSGNGAFTHREFAMASGEMDPEGFTAFLRTTLGHAARVCRDGAIAYVCMDWRHMTELKAAGDDVFTELKNVCVWNKSNAGMGTFYRSKHEMIFAFKVGTAPHINNFGLGEGGRHRTNVWDYPGATAATKERQGDLGMHPTVKPVRLVADAILDVTRRGGVVLDPFGGSGSTLIAAHKVGRTARLIEYDPLYCDAIVKRWEAFTGKSVKQVAASRKPMGDDASSNVLLDVAT